VNLDLLLRTVLLRFWRYKSRTIFMGLGITVGVLATVLLQTVTGAVRERFFAFVERAYPANSIVLVAGSGFMGGGEGRNNLRLADVETVVNTLGIKDWDPTVYVGFRDVKRGANSLQVNVMGYSEQAENVRRRSVQEGDFFTADEVKSRATVALIGSTTAARLFPGESAVGNQLFVDNVPFQVKGVLETVGVDPHGNDQDNAIEIPYTTLLDTMLRTNIISGAVFLVPDQSRVEETRNEVIKVVRERHQIGEGQKDDFSVITPALMQELLNRSFRTFNVFVPLIAVTVFLISALVILSIMQISIRARTPEIGLRKAVGARPRDLEAQIILEVLIVAVFASLAGLLLARLGIGLVVPLLATKFGIKQLSAPVIVLVVAVTSAIATGLVGGILPARRAAKLNPIKALK
jgi:putative ABC transport system permease protein